MKRWQWTAFAATLAAAAWFVCRKVKVRKGRLVVLQKSGDAPKKRIVPTGPAPKGVPDTAYTDACNIVRAGGLPDSEFQVEEGVAIWRHLLLDHRFEAVWAGDHWSLHRLINRDGAETPLPADLNRTIRDYVSLLADLQQRGLEPRPAGWS